MCFLSSSINCLLIREVSVAFRVSFSCPLQRSNCIWRVRTSSFSLWICLSCDKMICIDQQNNKKKIQLLEMKGLLLFWRFKIKAYACILRFKVNPETCSYIQMGTLRVARQRNDEVTTITKPNHKNKQWVSMRRVKNQWVYLLFDSIFPLCNLLMFVRQARSSIKLKQRLPPFKLRSDYKYNQ